MLNNDKNQNKQTVPQIIHENKFALQGISFFKDITY